jgi:hypothetical protein
VGRLSYIHLYFDIDFLYVCHTIIRYKQDLNLMLCIFMDSKYTKSIIMFFGKRCRV